MKKTLFLVLLVFLPPILLLADDSRVEIGMIEAKLIELKGDPKSKVVLGTKAIYRWPDMEVAVKDGKVSNVRLLGAAAEARAAKSPAPAGVHGTVISTASGLGISEGPFEKRALQVLQVIPGGGFLVGLMDTSGRGGYYLTGDIGYTTALPKCAEGDRFWTQSTPSGFYTYQGADGVSHTVHRYLLDDVKPFVMTVVEVHYP